MTTGRRTRHYPGADPVRRCAPSRRASADASPARHAVGSPAPTGPTPTGGSLDGMADDEVGLREPPWRGEMRLGLARPWTGEFAGTAAPGLLYQANHLRPRPGSRFSCRAEEPVRTDRDVVPLGGRGRLAHVREVPAPGLRRLTGAARHRRRGRPSPAVSIHSGHTTRRSTGGSCGAVAAASDRTCCSSHCGRRGAGDGIAA
jgi:hypothetical protein